MQKRTIAIFLLALLSTTTLTACNRHEMIAYFNKREDATVDNVAENTENVGNLVETENTMSTESTETEVAAETELAYTGPEIDIIMVGDMLMHTPVEESALQEDGTYSFDAIFANTVDEIQAADLAIVNQEVIIGGEKLGVSGYPCFNAPYELGHDLVEAGFDVVCHGTNHALDQGKKGLKNCLTFWEENYSDIAVLGIHGSSEDQEEIYIYEQDGVKIAILNFTYGTNGIALPSDMPYAVDLLEEEKVIAALAKAEKQADFIIVCPHWGTEYTLKSTKEQEKWKNIFLENGVDVVIGTHPHVIEPMEVVTNEAGEHQMLVYYSIGNFVNWTSSSGDGIANRMVGGMAKFTIGTDEAGEAILLEYGVEPVVCHLEEGTNGVTTYFLKDYTPELASRNQIVKQDGNFSYEYCVNLCEEVFGAYFEQE